MGPTKPNRKINKKIKIKIKKPASSNPNDSISYSQQAYHLEKKQFLETQYTKLLAFSFAQ